MTAELFTARMAHRAGAYGSVRGMLARGELVTVVPGVYVRADDWRILKPDARYRLRVEAVAQAYGKAVQISHDSAAAMYRLSSIGAWPTSVHSLAPADSGGRSRKLLTRHCTGLDASPFEIDGVTVTSLARTVVDVACSTSFLRAVGMLDDALRPPKMLEFRHDRVSPVTKSELFELLNSRASSRGVALARSAIEFADGLSGSPLESRSRVQMRYLNMPMPLLQVPFYDEEGLIGYADFYWPDLDLIGEADGYGKYTDPVLLRGKTPEEALIAEKKREDRMRRLGHNFVRWDTDVASDRRRFVARLAPFGVRPHR